MRKLSKKAKRFIIDFSSAAADLTNKAIRPNFIQFGEARAALMDYIAELEAEVAELKPYRDGYDPKKVFPPEAEWVWMRDCDDNIEPVQYDRKMEWYWNYGYNAKNFTTWDRLNGDLRRWYPIEKLPEVQE